MSLLNLAFVTLSLAIDPNTDDWLLEYEINSMSSMKSVRESINDFDKVYAQAIGILERCLQITSIVASENLETDEPVIIP
eukprot:13652603-Ditylum_brightwellii.AAC.1